MNKNKYILLGAVVLGLGLTSCSDFLNVDRYFRDQQSTERIFSDKDYTLQWLSFCYSRLQGDNLEVGHSDVCPFNFSDDQVFNERGDRFAKFKRGEYLNSTGGQNAWKWSYDGIYQAKYPRLSYGGNSNNYRASTYWLRNGSYIRLKNVELGYNIPKRFVNKLHLDRVRLYLMGTNLLTFSDFKLWDPELGSSNGQQYPLSRTVTIGLTVGI